MVFGVPSRICLCDRWYRNYIDLLKKRVLRVFFYHDGVNNGTRLATPPQDDRHIPNRWSELAKEHNIDLVLCVAAAQRRGMVDPDEMKRNNKDADNIAEKFRISGLGQLIEAGIQAERLITFGD